MIGSGGVLYGTTEVGGAYYVPPDGGCTPEHTYATYCEGAVFSLTPPAVQGGAWAEQVLWSFGGPSSAGSWPSGVVVGGGGVLYGTTQLGSQPGVEGTVFSLTPPAGGAGVWTEQDIHGFRTQPKAGASPHAGVAVGGREQLYGTTFLGGLPGCGTVFVLYPPASAGSPWTFATLWSFQAGSGGQSPAAALVQDGRGILYGTTSGTYTGLVASVFAIAP